MQVTQQPWAQAGLVDYLKVIVYMQVQFPTACPPSNEMPKSQVSMEACL